MATDAVELQAPDVTPSASMATDVVELQAPDVTPSASAVSDATIEEGVRKHVITTFIRRNQIKQRRVQRNRKESKESFRLRIQKWHASFRERLVRTGFQTFYHPKWGHFLPRQRWNVDQCPLPFCNDTGKTYELVEKGKKVWAGQPHSGADKRMCSLQICFRPEGKQPPIAIIFRGKGKRISKEEKQQWDTDVDVYWQKNAWADQQFCVQWAEKTLAESVSQEDRFVLVCDNLTSHKRDPFKDAIREIGGLIWYGEPNATDIWQPVDAGYGQQVKVMVKQAFFRWLEDDYNSDLWYDATRSFTASDKRILVTKWVGDAWRKLNNVKYDAMRRRFFEKTGCLLTATGEHDELVQPEGLPNYQVPAPSMADPSNDLPTTNDNDIHEMDDVVGLDEFENDDEMLQLYAEHEEVYDAQDDAQDDGNVFDIFSMY